MNWHVGQKVVRVKAELPAHLALLEHAASFPKVGDVCTIAGLNIAGAWLGITGLILKEWPNEPRGFLDIYFRPIDPLHEALDRIEEDGVKLIEQQPEFA